MMFITSSDEISANLFTARSSSSLTSNEQNNDDDYIIFNRQNQRISLIEREKRIGIDDITNTHLRCAKDCKYFKYIQRYEDFTKENE